MKVLQTKYNNLQRYFLVTWVFPDTFSVNMWHIQKLILNIFRLISRLSYQWRNRGWRLHFFTSLILLAPWHYIKTVCYNLKTPIKTMNYHSWVLGWGNKKDGSQCTWEVQNISTQKASIAFMFWFWCILVHLAIL